MNWNPFITCAITGSGASQDVHPDLPITPEQIANSAIEAARAAAVLSNGREPALTPGVYCGWCPRAATCPEADLPSAV